MTELERQNERGDGRFDEETNQRYIDARGEEVVGSYNGKNRNGFFESYHVWISQPMMFELAKEKGQSSDPYQNSAPVTLGDPITFEIKKGSEGMVAHNIRFGNIAPPRPG